MWENSVRTEKRSFKDFTKHSILSSVGSILCYWGQGFKSVIVQVLIFSKSWNVFIKTTSSIFAKIKVSVSVGCTWHRWSPFFGRPLLFRMLLCVRKTVEHRNISRIKRYNGWFTYEANAKANFIYIFVARVALLNIFQLVSAWYRFPFAFDHCVYALRMYVSDTLPYFCQCNEPSLHITFLYSTCLLYIFTRYLYTQRTYLY